MRWSALWDPVFVPEYLAGLAMLGLAAWLLYLDFGRVANRAFALLLILRGLTILFFSFSTIRLAFPADGGFFFWRMTGYFSIALPFALLYFVSVFPQPRAWLGRGRWAALLIAVAALGAEFAYAVNHDLYATIRAAGPANPCPGYGSDTMVCVDQWGPMLTFSALLPLGLALASVAFALDYVRMEKGSQRRSLAIVLLAFLLQATYDAVTQILGSGPTVIATAERGDWGVINSFIVQLAILPVLAALYILWVHASRAKDREPMAAVQRLSVALLLPIVSAAALYAVNEQPLTHKNPYGMVLLGLWRLSVPVLVVYALVRHQLFDADIKMKLTLKYGTIGATFFATAFILSESVAQVLGDRLGSQYIGIGLTGLLLFGIHPLQRMAERVASATVGDVKPLEKFNSREKHDFFAEQVRIVWADGTISRKERLLLDNLRERLGLAFEEASKLENKVLTALQAQQARPARRRRSANA